MSAYLNARGVICALGRSQAEVARSLFAGDCSGIRAESGIEVGGHWAAPSGVMR